MRLFFNLAFVFLFSSCVAATYSQDGISIEVPEELIGLPKTFSPKNSNSRVFVTKSDREGVGFSIAVASISYINDPMQLALLGQLDGNNSKEVLGKYLKAWLSRVDYTVYKGPSEFLVDGKPAIEVTVIRKGPLGESMAVNICTVKGGYAYVLMAAYPKGGEGQLSRKMVDAIRGAKFKS